MVTPYSLQYYNRIQLHRIPCFSNISILITSKRDAPFALMVEAFSPPKRIFIAPHQNGAHLFFLTKKNMKIDASSEIIPTGESMDEFAMNKNADDAMITNEEEGVSSSVEGGDGGAEMSNEGMFF